MPATVDDGAIGPVAEGVVGAEDGFVNSGETQVDGEVANFCCCFYVTPIERVRSPDLFSSSLERLPHVPCN